jgi:hypothetical protein
MNSAAMVLDIDEEWLFGGRDDKPDVNGIERIPKSMEGIRPGRLYRIEGADPGNGKTVVFCPKRGFREEMVFNGELPVIISEIDEIGQADVIYRCNGAYGRRRSVNGDVAYAGVPSEGNKAREYMELVIDQLPWNDCGRSYLREEMFPKKKTDNVRPIHAAF